MIIWLGVVLFGSSVYLGSGSDVDLIVIIDRDLYLKEKFSLECRLGKKLSKSLPGFIFLMFIFLIVMFFLRIYGLVVFYAV